MERLPTADVPDVDVAAAISGLPERERVAVTLVFGLGYRQDEAAELMGVAAGTVYSSVWRARRKLARLLAADEPISAPTGRSAR
jgi:RNA polymerase sigma-70 factor (ECF subfamily)